MKNDLQKKLFNIEVLFVLAAILNIWPIWFSSYFPTVDGPSHLYNSQLILELWNSDAFFSSFFEINSEWVPNWSGHFLLVLFQKIGFSVFFANKIILSLIALGIPLAFRSLLKTLGSPITGISFFSLIFVYTFLFALGFYNFGLGILMLLISIQFYLKTKKDKGTFIHIFLFISIGLCFFSHLVCFGILCLYFLVDFLVGLFKKENKFRIRHGLFTFLYCLPFVILSGLFFIGRESPDSSSYFGAGTLWALFRNLKILVLNFGETETLLAQIVFYVLMVFTLVSLFKLKSLEKNKRPFFILFALLLALFFVMPDAGSNGSFISRRILIFTFWFLLLALSPMFNFRWVNYSLILLVIGIQSFRTVDYFSNIKEQEKQVALLSEISKSIEDGSVVLNIWNGEGFKGRHFSTYWGLGRKILILDNYEANYGYFPVKWKDKFPSISLQGSGHKGEDCLKWKNNQGSENKFLIDYVLVYGNKKLEPCEMELFESINENYLELPIANSEGQKNQIRLFRRKSKAK